MANLDSAEWNGAAGGTSADGGASENCARRRSRRRFVVGAGHRHAEPTAFEPAVDRIALPTCDQAAGVVGWHDARVAARAIDRRDGADRFKAHRYGLNRCELNRRSVNGAQQGEELDDHDSPRWMRLMRAVSAAAED
jgi:hypothetical protein